MNPFWSISLFWIAAVLFVVLALAFILPPLLRKKTAASQPGRRDINIAVYREQMKEMETERGNGLLPEEQFQTARQELETRLAEDALVAEAASPPVSTGNRKLGFFLAAVLPIAAFGLYAWLGNPASLTLLAEAPSPAEPLPNPTMAEHDIKKMVEKAEAKVKANPEDGKGWALLAKTYAALGRWPEAWKAYQFAANLLPQDASLFSGQAEALAILNGRVLRGVPMELVSKALALDSNDMKGLELAGFNAFQEKNFVQAADFLGRLHKQLPPDAPYAKNILAALTEARRLSQNPTRDSAGERAAQAPASNVTIRGSIEIAPALKDRIGQQDLIFLFARPALGGAPVAVVRGSATRFPMDFELSDRWAMNPDNLLSQQKQVTMVARISKSGAPMGQPGDLEGSVNDVPVGAQGVTLVIDRVLP